MIDWSEYTAADLETEEPYARLLAIKDSFERTKEVNALSNYGKSIGFAYVKQMWSGFQKALNERKKTIVVESKTRFTGQPFELNAGKWRADDLGISEDGCQGELLACAHPIMPIERLVNIDTKSEKIRLAYKKDRDGWKDTIVSKSVISSRSKIVELSDLGISVNSENASLLVRYLSDVEDLNINFIPKRNSIGRLGWIKGVGFSPYLDEVAFDGEAQFTQLFNAVAPHGNFDIWLEAARSIRRTGNVVPKIALAASLASPLVELCDCLPFMLHIWGTAGGGKSVTLLLAASVWASPKMGDYVYSFKSTQVGHETKAGFLNSLPLILDELQVIRDKSGNDNLIYELCEGVGKTRGTKNGGLQVMQTWHNCIITSGEQPIVNLNSGGGAALRVIEVNCGDYVPLFADPRALCNTIQTNYGHCGKQWIELLKDAGVVAKLREYHDKAYKKIIDGNDIDDKQALSAALIIAADALATEYIFKDSQNLRISQVKRFLTTKAQADVNQRAYDWLMGTLSVNAAKFAYNPDKPGNECWGKLEEDYVWIVRTVFDKTLNDAGFDSRAFLSWAERKNVLKKDLKTGGVTKVTYLPNRERARCICLRRPSEEVEEDEE